MILTIEVADENAERLRKQAEARGLTLEEWVQAIVRERARDSQRLMDRRLAQSDTARMLELQRQGWTVRDYLERGGR